MDWDAVSYVSRSKYRTDILRELEGGAVTPSALASKTDHRQPHVSRALRELREEGLVELLVPEEQTQGRLYGITEEGREVWSVVREDIGAVEWGCEEPTDPAHRRLLSFLRDRVGDALRVVSYYDREEVTVLYADETVKEAYDQSEFQQGIQKLIADGVSGEPDQATPHSGALGYEIRGYERFVVLRLYDEGDQFDITFDPSFTFEVPPFVEACQERL